MIQWYKLSKQLGQAQKKSGGVRRGSFVNIQKQSVVGVFLKAGYLAWFHESNPISNRFKTYFKNEATALQP